MSVETPHKAGETQPSELEQLPVEALPKAIYEYGGMYSSIPSQEVVERAFCIDYGQGHVSFVIEKKSCSGQERDLVVVVDTINNVCAGHTTIQIASNGFASVGYTETRKGANFQSKGLGKQRLILANRYLSTRTHKPLYSGIILTKQAHAVWKNLIKDGLTERTFMSRRPYRFRRTP